ncbi:hypothetical protein GSI_12851 [Ganoderma sinense ZZ0214-1]|uniref:C3H1-type domain-containing protein n=1 Tax=Ganoderma sinense ZZ0214-1 TaxID=1077348 RepID=A0A2G8RU08_9APHY|nr:hypothetical protein GSI_12851 [Ganoderma sinense ZZ0214-1]
MSNPLNATPNPSPGRSRPVTSKARGICAYYNTKYGCYAGDRCKFLHGQDERLTSYDRSKVCRFYAAGYCIHGDKCWFVHADPGSSSSKPPADFEEENLCAICYDKPTTYGLLGDWLQSCLLSIEGDSRKAEAIEKYKGSMARVKCRHFEQSPPGKRFCPFGNECFFKHENVDGTSYLFQHGADFYMGRRGSRRNESDFEWEHPNDNLEQMLDGIRLVAHMSTRDIQQAILSSVAAFFGRDPMYRLDEGPAREDVIPLVADESEGEEQPPSLQPPQSEEAMANPLSGGLVGPHQAFAGSSTTPRSPVSTATSTLDPDSPIFEPLHLDNLRPLPSGPEEDAAHLERLFRGLEDQQRAIQENVSSSSEPSFPSIVLNTPPSGSTGDEAVQDADPPFMTDGRGRVVWSRRSSSLSRVRATSSSATILPHSKSTIDLTSTQEDSDGGLQQTSPGRGPSSIPRQLVRRRSVPLVGSSAGAEFVTDGRGRVVFASSDR